MSYEEGPFSFLIFARDSNSNISFRSGDTDEEPNYCIASLDSYPPWLNEEPVNYLNIFAALCFSAYLFWMLAYCCDFYLIPAVELLCQKLHVPYDVGGATFMAIATSAPELFVNVIGTFFTQTDLGLGTIVGSSLCNQLLIPAICGLVIVEPKRMEWWSVSRETIWYIISIILMAIFFIDSRVSIYESCGFLIVYILNLTCLLLDDKIRKCFGRMCARTNWDFENKTELDEEEEEQKTFKETICGYPKEESICKRITWIISYPFVFVFALTIPPVRFFYLTLIFAILWIAVMCFLIAWFLSVVGYNIGISDAIMGLTFIAIGTSVPEGASSYVATRRGHGDMAIGNAIGSNIFNILVCLGLPWLIENIKEGRDIPIVTEGMVFVTCALIATAVILFCIFLITKFMLNRIIGIATLIMYLVFLAGSLTLFVMQCVDKENSDPNADIAPAEDV